MLWTDGYDAADQLTSAVLTNTAITSPAVRSDSYGYDAAGNLNSQELGTVSRSPSYNALNQLTGSTPSGNQTVNFTGSLNEGATVTVNGTAATVSSGTNFSGGAVLAPGTTNSVPVVATDSHGNSRTNNYQTIVPSEPSYSPTFDPDGNELTTGAGQTYTWDAKNELASITYTGGASTVFSYDVLGHRIGIVEKNSGGTVISTKQLVWDGSKIAEERNVSNTVTKRFFAQGEQISGTSYYYTFDHLGSVREMTDGTGAIQARYDYDPYGRVTPLADNIPSDFQYAGYYEHAISGLNLTLFRAYDPVASRWLSRDPLGEITGPNLYGYVDNSPVNFYDPSGQFLAAPGVAAAAGTSIGVGGAAAAVGVGAVGLGIGYEFSNLTGFSDYGGDWLANNVFAPKGQPAMPPPKPPGGGTTVAAGGCPGDNNGENEHTARGKEAHKWWQPPEGYVKNFQFDNGLKPDAINFDTQDIIELKPDNPGAISAGQAQVQQYIQSAQQQFGGTWTGSVQTY